MNQSSPQAPPPPETRQVGFRLPLSQPRFTYILLAVNIVVWIGITLAGLARGFGLNGTGDVRLLVAFGANFTPAIAQGEYWRLLTSMFLHGGLVHLLFNSYALFIIGRDVESLYGSQRFLAIYFLSGLGGSVFSYALGSPRVSVGASGAIFGLIGADIAYFFLHREMFGPRGQAQLRNLLVVAVINLLFGATVPGIDNWAQLGGLVLGLGLGWALAPRYEAPSVLMPGAIPTLEDRNSLPKQRPAIGLAALLLVAVVFLGNQRWTGRGLLEHQDRTSNQTSSFHDSHFSNPPSTTI